MSKGTILVHAYFTNPTNGVCRCCVPALSGILFPGKEEAAYSSFRLWEATGSVIMYVLSPFLRNSFKIYFLLLIMTLGLIGYLAIEFSERKAKKGLPQKLDFELVDDSGKTSTMVAEAEKLNPGKSDSEKSPWFLPLSPLRQGDPQSRANRSFCLILIFSFSCMYFRYVRVYVCTCIYIFGALHIILYARTS